VIVTVAGVPGQEPPAVFSTGVTVIVAVCMFALVFVVTNDAILPVPEAARPIDVLLFVQLKTVPAIVPPKVMADVDSPLHSTWPAHRQ
jgi:hypothetical protein